MLDEILNKLEEAVAKDKIGSYPMVTITKLEYEALLETDTRRTVLLEFLKNKEYVSLSDIKMILGAEVIE